MEPDSFATLPGEYIGNVAGTPLNVGSLAKTGKIYIAIEGVNKLSIFTQSMCTKELTVNVQLDELRKAYDQKQTVLLQDGTKEERFEYETTIYDDYGPLIGIIVKGFTKTYYYYQFKFRANKLSAIRVQTYGSENKANITYSLEIHSIQKINKQPEKQPEPLKLEGKKTDWNF